MTSDRTLQAATEGARAAASHLRFAEHRLTVADRSGLAERAAEIAKAAEELARDCTLTRAMGREPSPDEAQQYEVISGELGS